VREYLAGRSSLNTDANQAVLGTLLNERYQIVQVLSAGAFEQTYIAEDSWQSGNPQCMVKHLKPKGNHPKRWQIVRRRFAMEAQTLKKMGSHKQIPQLLDCFEDKQGFYLVQELIVGEPLSVQLPISKHCSNRWSEVQCIELLDDVLGILEFIHSQGVIHGDLKPSNLIRRITDSKLVLIDFGAVHPIHPTQTKQRSTSLQLPITPVAVRLLGYIPAEQFIGQPYPSSDLYALGMIAIEAVTGLNPSQLQTEPNTGEVNWQQQVSVSQPLAYVLNQMVRCDFKDRYQSATDVRVALKRLAIRSEDKEVREEELSNRFVCESPAVLQPPVAPAKAEATALSIYVREFARSCWPKLPPLLTGIGAGMATSNALAISFGLYTLLHSAPSNPGGDLLARATEQYQAGNFKDAIALAKSIPTNSSAYQDSLKARKKWQQEWNTAAAQFKAVEEAFNEGRWTDVLEEAGNTPNIALWQQKIEPFVEQAKLEIEAESQQLLKQAYQRAALDDFTGAIALIEQIPPQTPTGAKIQPKLTEYKQKQQIKADHLLQKAYELASKKDFSGALKYLSQIPNQTPTYEQAQIKIAEYSQKQDIQEGVQRQATLNANFPKEEPNVTELSQRPNSSKASENLNPGNHLQEVTPQPVLATPTRR
jgi:serine/threonine protein kinase